jgi:hypothetical protein
VASVFAELLDVLLGGYRVRYRVCSAENARLESEVERLNDEAYSRDCEIGRLQSLCDEYIMRVETAEADAARFYGRLIKAAEFPAIEEVADLSAGAVVDPWIMTPEQWRGVNPIYIGDDLYYAYPEEEWLRMLAPVQAEVKRVVKRKADSISDCENWSLTMCTFLSICFMRAGLDKQGAFLSLSSGKHNYCGYMLPDYTIMVYEPLNGRTIGVLGETVDLYATKLAAFLT